MKIVVACIDNSAAARPVLAAARPSHRCSERGRSGARPEDGDRLCGPPPTMRMCRSASCRRSARQLIAVSAADDVVAVAIGARDLPGGRRTAGHFALALANHVDTPILVVPPDAQPPEQLHRVLIAMEGTPANMRRSRTRSSSRSAADIELIVVHVDDESSIPSFSDQVQHETRRTPMSSWPGISRVHPALGSSCASVCRPTRS